jgi:putative phosphoesterase
MVEKIIAVISDVHGNSWALSAVLEDLKKRTVDVIFNLGDSLYGPLDPAGTFQLLRKQDMVSISGNEDRLIVESVDSCNKNNTIKYVLSELGSEALHWLRTLPLTRAVDDFFLCHGTPEKDDVYLIEKITPRGVELRNAHELLREIRTIKQAVICCGHSHMKNLLEPCPGRYIVNPGSVGLPAYEDPLPHPHAMESGNPNASYCIVKKENNRYRIEHVLVSYDWEAAAECATGNYRDDWSNWLRTGKA